MALNVNRDVQDPFYRYKMPKLVAKVEGKGNGVKTVIANIVDIARALERPPTYCTKFFGCELGAQTQFDFKNDRYIVNGAHEATKLQDMLDGFIRKFVLCEKCDNPETVLKVLPKKGVITASCLACGHNFTLDMRHKLTAFILKNPPDHNLKSQGTSLTERKEKKSKRNKDKSENGENCDDHHNESFTAAVVDDDDGEWSVDVSEEAVKRRMKDLTSGVKGLAMDDDQEKSESARVNLFHDYLKAMKGRVQKFSPTEEKEMLQEAERLEVVNKAPIVLCELFLTGDNIVPQIKEHKRLFLRFTNDNLKSQKYLMGGFEKTIESKEDLLLPKAVQILKTFYDEDILDEQVILEWNKKVSKKYVSKELSDKIHKKVEPFVTWLKEAEEEEEESTDDELELDFDERAKISSIKEKKEVVSNGKTAAASEAVDEKVSDQGNGEADDLDIDDI